MTVESTPLKPTRCADGCHVAYEMAIERGEPILCPISLHADDRGWSIMNQFQRVLSPEGQVNFSLQYPGVCKAWHRHERQTDFWICTHGHLRAGVYDEHQHRSWTVVLGARSPGMLIVPPRLWHGAATIGHEPAGLLYYVSHAYDPTDPDEQRRAHDSVPGFEWNVVHG